MSLTAERRAELRRNSERMLESTAVSAPYGISPQEVLELLDAAQNEIYLPPVEAASIHLDLSQLQIPDVSVVPEPTAEQWEAFREYIALPREIMSIHRIWITGLSRRCREMEDKHNKWCRMVGAEIATSTTAIIERNKHIAELESEVERLKRNIETVVDYMDTGEGSFPENWNIRDHLKVALDGD